MKFARDQLKAAQHREGVKSSSKTLSGDYKNVTSGRKYVNKSIKHKHNLGLSSIKHEFEAKWLNDLDRKTVKHIVKGEGVNETKYPVGKGSLIKTLIDSGSMESSIRIDLVNSLGIRIVPLRQGEPNFSMGIAGEIPILGRCSGIKKDEKYVNAICELPLPPDVKSLMSFIGSVIYLHKFLPGFADVAKPLTQMTSSNRSKMREKIVWDETKLKAFEAVRELVKRDVELSYPRFNDVNNPLKLFTDASSQAAGSCLMQTQDGVDRIIAFHSTTFSKTERAYSVTELELLALKLGIQAFEVFLKGNYFVAYTDHAPLLHLTSLKNFNGRITRTLEYLSNFNFSTVWIPGRENIISDMLSRTPQWSNNGENVPNLEIIENYEYLPEGIEIGYEPNGGGNSILRSLMWSYKGLNNDMSGITESSIHELRQAWTALKNVNSPLPHCFIQAFANLYKGDGKMQNSNCNIKQTWTDLCSLEADEDIVDINVFDIIEKNEKLLENNDTSTENNTKTIDKFVEKTNNYHEESYVDCKIKQHLVLKNEVIYYNKPGEATVPLMPTNAVITVALKLHDQHYHCGREKLTSLVSKILYHTRRGNCTAYKLQHLYAGPYVVIHTYPGGITYDVRSTQDYSCAFVVHHAQLRSWVKPHPILLKNSDYRFYYDLTKPLTPLEETKWTREGDPLETRQVPHANWRPVDIDCPDERAVLQVTDEDELIYSDEDTGQTGEDKDEYRGNDFITAQEQTFIYTIPDFIYRRDRPRRHAEGPLITRDPDEDYGEIIHEPLDDESSHEEITCITETTEPQYENIDKIVGVDEHRQTSVTSHEEHYRELLNNAIDADELSEGRINCMNYLVLSIVVK
ncbi:unnamed protein product [Rotaria magnacalcarata]|uniref:Reverse transcriptase RNase H-like domain-containing protein n=1 Tax=Rotaria magnacalcarata TaxID=392030 RepID=A0A819XH99_9BILA|nr:unnamed protein product [Rotaria magnacalcarata]